jgi:lipoate-protein ligase A
VTPDKGAALGGHWRILHERGTAGDLHTASAEALNDLSGGRTVRFCDAVAPSLVLGSHQPEAMFSRPRLAAAGIELARRRSGGSAVLVGPDRVLWADFVIGKADPLWDDDVGRAAWWVGELWASAIGDGEVWRGRMQVNEWSASVCFAGVGPGEVLVGGRKVVGVCQRRTARAALFQTAALLEWHPEEYVAVMVPPSPDVEVLARSATGLDAAAGDLKSALVARLMP